MNNRLATPWQIHQAFKIANEIIVFLPIVL